MKIEEMGEGADVGRNNSKPMTQISLVGDDPLLTPEHICRAFQIAGECQKSAWVQEHCREQCEKAAGTVQKTQKRAKCKVPKKGPSKCQKKFWKKIKDTWKKFKAQKADIKAMLKGKGKWDRSQFLKKRFDLAKEQLALAQYGTGWYKDELMSPSNLTMDWKVKCEKKLQNYIFGKGVVQLRQQVVDELQEVLRLEKEKQKAKALVAKLKANKGSQELGDASELSQESA